MEKLLPFELSHLDLIEIREVELQSAFILPDAKERMRRMLSSTLEAGTFMMDGRIIFAAGVAQLWPGVLEGWIIPSVYVPDYSVWFVKKIKGYFEAFAETFNCHRFQTVSLNDAFHDRWMDAIGFTKEGILKNYDHNKRDYAMYARIF